MHNLLCVGFGGFIGACLRYIISITSSKLFETPLPYGTLIVNVIGGVLIGLIMKLSLTTDLISPNLRLFFVTGIIGALTTFSTFSYETINLFNGENYVLGILNICLNLFFSLGGVVVGQLILYII